MWMGHSKVLRITPSPSPLPPPLPLVYVLCPLPPFLTPSRVCVLVCPRIDDMNAIFTKYPDPTCVDCAVHEGFWLTYLCLREQFMDAYHAAQDKAPHAQVGT